MERLGRWTYTHRWKTLIIWIVALFGFLVASAAFKGPYEKNFSLPGSESQRALDLLKGHFQSRAGGTVDVVFESRSGVRGIQPKMESFFADIGGLTGVDNVVSPYAPNGARQLSRDGTIAFAEVHFKQQATEIPKATVEKLFAMGDALKGPDLKVEYGGDVVQFAVQEQPGGAEGVGLLAAIMILFFTFGSLLAMGLPLLSAIFGITIGLSLVLLFANFISVPVFAPQVAAMIGIGVGIDYALFMVTRFRQGLHDGLDPEEATVLAMTTSGRSVLFAGTVVVISLLGILLMGFRFIQGLAVGGAAAVFVTMLASITLLPAMLGFVGRNIDKLHVPGFLQRTHESGHGFWYRWSRFIQRRPWVAALAGLVALVVLALPLFHMRLGSADAGNDPTKLTTRRAYDLLSKGFGAGFNGPLILAAEVHSPQDLQALNHLSDVLRTTPGIAIAARPFVAPNGGGAAIITAYPADSPQDASTSQLVKDLRARIIPDTMRGTGVNVYIGGLTAVFVDFASKIAQRLPLLFTVVIAFSFLLLMVVFRSILVPVKAAIMNLLSIGASYGVIVAVFQYGWGSSLIGVGKRGPIESWIPMMMFTILFGLSMDYEIFLLSRIREAYEVSRDNAASVAEGVAQTGRVITAAAAIMIVVFLTFVIGFDGRQIKELGLGLAVAVFVDATFVRMILVPATMELLGSANWWLPGWLDRALPRVALEPRAREAVAESGSR